MSENASLTERIKGRWDNMTFLWRDFAELRLNGAMAPKPPLNHPLLFVWRRPSLWNHPFRSLLRWIRLIHPDVRLLELQPNASSLNDRSAKLAAASVRDGTVLAYDNCLSLTEVSFLKDRGLNVAMTSEGFKSLNHGRDDESQVESLKIFRLLDLYFVSHEPHADILRSHGVRAQFLPHWYDDRWFFPMAGVEKRFDLLYVGTARDDSRDGRYGLLKSLSREFRLGLAGPLEDFRGLSNAVLLGQVGDPRLMNKLHNQARLVLGGDSLNAEVERINRRPGQFLPYTLRHHIKHRTYCTLGSGACYLVEDHPTMRSAFVNGEEVVLWQDSEGLMAQCRRLLADSASAARIGHAGQARVAAQHTTRRRLGEILDAMTAVGVRK